ncbi:MAG: UDP-N-acetylmuramoyl-L-alanyl-D-glutamate--2,6-diaminopimelate ligase [Fusicatenibacter sp.]|nr:UDP-N-acetylmuramoyl-L-alanyl-D-glutamate--2,6-diaminopimelate ligase [Fusicatenibacter sp.]
MIKQSMEKYRELLDKEGILTESELGEKAKREVTGITYHSQKVRPGNLFLCKGAAFREEYLEEAVSRGAAGYVSQRKYSCGNDIPHLLVSDMRKAQFVLGEAYYGNPAEKLHLVGITGTKGKTTTAYYLRAILSCYLRGSGGDGCGLLSSIEYDDGMECVPSTLTTPEPLELFRHMRNAVDSGNSHMVMEVSSQALKYQRIGHTKFDTAVFLNISEDHISPGEHEDFRDYFESKLKIFDHCRCACINLDCEYAQRIADAAKKCERVVTFGQTEAAMIRARNVTVEKGKIHFLVEGPDFTDWFTLDVHGAFNVENALAAIAAAWSLKVPLMAIRKGLQGVRVPGRMETFQSHDGEVTVIVDYAHNGLSFTRIFDAVEQEYPGSRITVVFGCPGGKAYNRRKDLGEIAGSRADLVYLVPDDPGEEDPGKISEEISGYVEAKGCPCRIRMDRGSAIREAVLDASCGEVILVLGKGEESFIRYGTKSCPYRSDAENVKAALREYGNSMLQSAATREET